jgi:hypothetical protein
MIKRTERDQRTQEEKGMGVELGALVHRLPAIYPWHFYTDAGGLMSYAALAGWRRAGERARA